MNDRPHVSVCLTTIKPRLHLVAQTIQSIIEQNYPNFDLNVYLSRDPYLLDAGVPTPTEIMMRLPKASIGKVTFRYVQNVGPYRKSIPFLANAPRDDALFVTADDDTIYPDYWLESLVDGHLEHGCIVCYRGHRMTAADGEVAPYRTWAFKNTGAEPSLSILPTGKDGVLYRPSFFHSNVLRMGDAKIYAPTADDVWVKWHTAIVGVPVVCLHPDARSGTLPEAGPSKGLYSEFNKGGGNDAAIKSVGDHFKAAYNFSMADLL